MDVVLYTTDHEQAMRAEIDYNLPVYARTIPFYMINESLILCNAGKKMAEKLAQTIGWKSREVETIRGGRIMQSSDILKRTLRMIPVSDCEAITDDGKRCANAFKFR